MVNRSQRVPSLSKSRILSGMQCPKKLYLQIFSPELASETTEVQQAVFDQGTEVGIEARTRFPDGILIEAPYTQPDKALADTQLALNAGALTLFEAAFRYQGVLVRVDILHRTSKRAAWQLIEVKSSTKAKTIYITDIAVQAWVLRAVGLKVKSCSLMLINNQCVFPDLGELFKKIDVTLEVHDLQAQLPNLVARLESVLKKSSPPKLDIGPYCNSPYPCPFIDHCWGPKKIPSPNIFELPGVGSKAWDYYYEGIVALTDPRLVDMKNPKTQRAIQVARSGVRFVDPPAILDGLKKWKWPLYFLDFETINPAIPRFPGTRSFVQIPFQFSCHIQDEPGGRLRQVEYLHDDASDPRLPVAQALLEGMGPSGSVVAYSMSTERGCMQRLAEAAPDLATDLDAVCDRLVDPLPIIQNGVYDVGFRGSFSIKTVAPALLGESMSYDSLAVGEGQEAQVAFAEMIAFGTSPARKEALRKSLLEYCRQDTLAMVKVVKWLFDHAGE